MNRTEAHRVAVSAAWGLAVVGFLLVVVLGMAGRLDADAVAGLVIAIVAYGALVHWRLRRSGPRRSRP